MITVGTTTHFAVQYDETITSNGQQLGQGLLQTCEGDYATLRDIFGGVDPPAPIRVTVDNGAGGAENRHDIIHDGDAGQGAAGDFDYLRNAFVAELAELFMYAQNRKWNPGDSKGEALSRVLGGFLYPGGQQPGFTVHQWVDNLPDGLNPSEDQPTGPEGLEDWITKVDGNDTRAKSIGCGVAFIHYLHYQLGFPFSQIVGTSGDTLEDVCQALTGTSGAFQPFADLVRATYPAGHPSGLNASSKFPDSDVLFPLFDRGLGQGVGRGVCARTPDHLDLFWVSGLSLLQTAWWDASQAGWNSYTIAGTRARRGSPVTAVARHSGHLDLFWIDPGNNVFTAWWDAGQQGWHSYPIGGIGARGDSSLTVIARSPDHLDLFWIGSDNNVWTAWWDNAAVGWNPYPIAGAAAGGASQLAVAARNPYYLDLFWVDPSGAVETAGWDATRTGWTIQTVGDQQARTGSFLTALARYPDHLDLFWEGTDNAIKTAWWDAAQPGWHPYGIDNTGTRGDSPLSVVARNRDHIDLFWIAPDNSVQTAWWDASAVGWNPYAITGTSAQNGSALEVVARNPNHLDLFWYGSDEQVHTAWWDESQVGWNPYAIEGTQVGDIRFGPFHP